LYLMAPCAWLGWLDPVLLGASIATPAITVVLGIRLLRLRRAQVFGLARNDDPGVAGGGMRPALLVVLDNVSYNRSDAVRACLAKVGCASSWSFCRAVRPIST
jgi:hypothetical protein